MPKRGIVAGWVLAVVGSVLAAPPAWGQAPSFLGKTAAQWHDELSAKRPADVRRSAAFALGSLGKDATRSLDALLTRADKDDDAGVRDQAATAIGDIVLADKSGRGLWPQVGPVLQRCLAAEKDAKARRSLVYALGAFGPTAFTARHLLKQTLNDREPAVRQNAAWALGRLGEDAGAEIVQALCDQLKDGDPLVRRDVATALGELGKSAAELAVPRLLELVGKETNDVVRRTVLEQLVNLVAPGDKSVFEVVSPLVRDHDPETARLAAFVVANVGGDEAKAALPLLREALHDHDPRMQGLAAAALARLGPAAADAVDDLTQLLGESTDDVTQRNCALALGRIGAKAKPGVPALVAHLKPPAAAEVRLFCAEAIARLGFPHNKEAFPALLDTIEHDADLNVRRACIFSFMAIDDLKKYKPADQVLLKVLDEAGDDTTLLRYDAARTLAIHLHDTVPDKVIDVLLHMLGNKSLLIFQGREAKVSGVGAEGPGGTSPVKVNLGGDARFLAAIALSETGRKAAFNDKVVAALKEAAEDQDERLRQEARAALKKLGR